MNINNEVHRDIFVGNGIVKLKEANITELNPVDFVSIPLLGVYPHLQGLIVKGIAILSICIGIWAARLKALDSNY